MVFVGWLDGFVVKPRWKKKVKKKVKKNEKKWKKRVQFSKIAYFSKNAVRILMQNPPNPFRRSITRPRFIHKPRKIKCVQTFVSDYLNLVIFGHFENNFRPKNRNFQNCLAGSPFGLVLLVNFENLDFLAENYSKNGQKWPNLGMPNTNFWTHCSCHKLHHPSASFLRPCLPESQYFHSSTA